MRLARRFLALVLVFLCLAAASSTSTLHAQGEAPPRLRITQIYTDKFPDVDVYVTVDNSKRPQMESLKLALTEDGTNHNPSQGWKPVGTQTALLLDSSGSLRDPGATGEPRYSEVEQALRRLSRLGALLPEHDWLAAYAADGNRGLVLRHDWNNKHGDVINELLNHPPPDNIATETPLFNLLNATLNTFNKQSVPLNVVRSIVVFSDGERGGSPLEVGDSAQAARQLNVAIHTVLLGTGNGEGRRTLERLAQLTGGQFYPLDRVEALDTLWRDIGDRRMQVVLHYRSSQAQPRSISVRSVLPDGTRLEDRREFPSLELSPVQVKITELGARGQVEKQVERKGTASDTPLGELEPKQLAVRLVFDWPDKHPRAIKQVEYTLDTVTRVPKDPPFDQFALPIDTLGDGDHSLRVLVRDELGLAGTSDPLTFRVTVRRPLPPTSVPTGASSAVQPVKLSPVQVVIGLLALVAAIGLLALLLRSRRPPRATAEPVKDMTVSDPGGEAGPARAILVRETGPTSLPPELAITSDNTPIGRDPQHSDIVLSQPKVSKLHSRIKLGADGQLYINDEASKNRTFVNHVPVESAQRLRSGDLIGFGRDVAYRFYYKDDYPRGTEPVSRFNESDTQPAAL